MEHPLPGGVRIPLGGCGRGDCSRGAAVPFLLNLRAGQPLAHVPPYHENVQVNEGACVAAGTKHTVPGWPYDNVELSSALLKLSDLIVEVNRSDELGYAASEMLGRALGVSRVGYSAIDTEADTLHTSKDWCAPGVFSLTGILQLRDYGSFIDSLKRGEVVSIADVREDERTTSAADALEHAFARSFVNIPVVERGHLRALLFVNSAKRRVWTKDELALIQEFARRMRTAMGRLEAEATIRKSEEKFRTFVEAISDVVYRVSADWTHALQVEGRDFLPTTVAPDPYWFKRNVHPDDQERVWARIQKSIREGSVFELEHKVQRLDGSLGWTFSRAIPVRDELGHVVEWFGAASDITARKQAEHALVGAEKLAVVGRLASSIAHEINNPLEAVTNLLYIAEQTADAETKTTLLAAQQELQRVSQIAANTLQFNRQKLSPAPMAVSQSVESVLNLYEGRIRQAGIDVILAMRACPPLTALGDEIRQVLVNLVGNAVDAMKRGGVLTIRARPSTDWKTGAPIVRITVADNGHGMNSTTLLQIYKPFFTTRNETGTGLGLWISAGIIHRHHGHIRVRSSEDEAHSGTTFSLLLPYDGIAHHS